MGLNSTKEWIRARWRLGGRVLHSVQAVPSLRPDLGLEVAWASEGLTHTIHERTFAGRRLRDMVLHIVSFRFQRSSASSVAVRDAYASHVGANTQTRQDGGQATRDAAAVSESNDFADLTIESRMTIDVSCEIGSSVPPRACSRTCGGRSRRS